MILRSAFFILLLAVASPAAFAQDDRMSGRIPGTPGTKERQRTDDDTPRSEKPDDENKSEEKPEDKKPMRPNGNNAQPKSPVVNTPQPHTGTTMDRKAMESLGPLTNPLKGGLGDDMWTGSSRSVAQDYIPQLPAGNTLMAVQLLARRVLLSNGDASLLRNDKTPEAGRDIFTLRLEKLLEIGAYGDAVDLYTLIEGEPGNDRLARAGVMALMFDGYPAQACLEVRAAHKDVAAVKAEGENFWPQIEAVCNFVQSDSVRALKDPSLKIASPVSGIPGSKVLTTLVSRADYRHTVSSPGDLAELSDMERAVLRGLGRLDYSRFKIKRLEDISSPILMTMATDPNMAVQSRLILNVEAAERGLISDSQLGALYIDIARTTEQAGPNVEPSNSLFGRYYAAVKPEAEGAERNSIVSALLETQGDGLPTALLPFADMVPSVNPNGLSHKAVRTGLLLMLQNGMSPPERWVNAWLKGESSDSRKSREDLVLYLANLVPENLPTESVAFPDDQVKTLFSPAESAESLEIYAVFSGLGRADVLHNYTDPSVYEKHLDLTLINDYVMPIDSVMDKIREAAKNDRLGETVLLASVALKEYSPAKTHPGVLREVLKSLETVGLKEEARNVALGVVWGLNK